MMKIILVFVIYMQASAQGASVKGLKGRKTLNKDPDPKNPLEGTEERFVSLDGMLLSQDKSEMNSTFAFCFRLLAG